MHPGGFTDDACGPWFRLNTVRVHGARRVRRERTVRRLGEDLAIFHAARAVRGAVRELPLAAVVRRRYAREDAAGLAAAAEGDPGPLARREGGVAGGDRAAG